MSFISTLRLVVLSLCSVFGLAILGITAHLTAVTTKDLLLFFDFEGLGLFNGILSTLAIPTMLGLGATRQNAFMSMIVVELCVLGLIWILWLANAAVLAQWTQIIYPGGCGVFRSGSLNFTTCHQFLAAEGLSFVSWLLLMIYTGILLVLSLKSESRVWTMSVNQANFSAPSGDREVATEAGAQQLPANNIGSVNSPYSAVPMHGSQQFQYPPGANSSSVMPQASVPMQQTSYTAFTGQQQQHL